MDITLLAFGDAGWGDEMLRGAAMTIVISVVAMSIGLVFGILGSVAKLYGGLASRGIAETYTTIVRGVPELLVIYLLFFGSSPALNALVGMFGYDGRVQVPNFVAGTFAVGLVSGAYSTEVLRGAILSIPIGQFEAARAFGMSPWLAFRRITFPQMVRFALPGIGNVWQLTLKDTSLISVTGLTELMRAADVAKNSTRQPFIFFLTAAVIYLCITSVTERGFKRAEAWSERGVRRG